MAGGGAADPRRWKDIWWAGHSVSGVTGVPAVAGLIDEMAAEYAEARAAALRLL